MRGPHGAYTVAERMLGNLALTPQQSGQLRAIDHKYQQALFTMLNGAQRAPTITEMSQLDEIAARDIRVMLTPDQRRQIDGR
ncbi:MAG TPA: hypothetical protein VJN70_10125 [Gemmatimonadaceae bacterium]|nr:hypothetical protein [Gemmatimonadaceae bacterium]